MRGLTPREYFLLKVTIAGFESEDGVNVEDDDCKALDQLLADERIIRKYCADCDGIHPVITDKGLAAVKIHEEMR